MSKQHRSVTPVSLLKAFEQAKVAAGLGARDVTIQAGFIIPAGQKKGTPRRGYKVGVTVTAYDQSKEQATPTAEDLAAEQAALDADHTPVLLLGYNPLEGYVGTDMKMPASDCAGDIGMPVADRGRYVGIPTGVF